MQVMIWLLILLYYFPLSEKTVCRGMNRRHEIYVFGSILLAMLLATLDDSCNVVRQCSQHANNWLTWFGSISVTWPLVGMFLVFQAEIKLPS